MAIKLRRIVSELMIYDANDKSCSDEAKNFLSSHKYGAWTVDARGIDGAEDLSSALRDFCWIKQISFCTHGYSGGVYFTKGTNLDALNLKTVIIRPDLFDGAGRILFMGCETAKTKKGIEFIIAAGKHFFKGKGGIIGGATIKVIGLTSGARLPLLGLSWSGISVGKLILFKLNAAGIIVDKKNVLPFGL